MKTDRFVLQKGRAANIGKRSHSGRHFRSRDQELIGTEGPQTLENLVLPLVCAHRAIVRGWAEPHYLGSLDLMPAGTVVVYTPKDNEEVEVCSALFFESYLSGLTID